MCTRMMCARTQATLPLIARRAYGVEHALHTFCQRQTPMGALSRLVCGVTVEQRLIVNMPGSERAVKVCASDRSQSVCMWMRVCRNVSASSSHFCRTLCTCYAMIRSVWRRYTGA